MDAPAGIQPQAIDWTMGDSGRRLGRLREIASLVNLGSDIEAVLERIAFAVCGAPPWVRSGIMAVDRASGYSELVSRHDPTAPANQNLPRRWTLTTSPSLTVVENRRPVIIDDAQTSLDYPDYRADAIARGYRTVVVLPLGGSDERGREMVLAVHSVERLRVPPEELDFLMTAAHLAGIAIERAKLLRDERQLTTRLRRTLDINSSLLERVLGGAQLSAIVAMVGAILPDPLVVLDFTDGSVHPGRAPEGYPLGDREWGSALEGAAGRSLAALVRRSPPSDFRLTQEVDLRDGGVALRCPAFVEPLQVDGQTVGGLVLFAGDHALDDLDRLIAQEAKFALSAQLMRHHVELRREALDLSDLFDRLTQDVWPGAQTVVAKAARLGIELKLPLCLLAFELPAAAADLRERPSAPPRPLTALSQTLKQSAGVLFAAEQGGFGFLLLPTTGDGPPPAVQRRIADAVRWHCGGETAVAIGPTCRDLQEVRRGRDQCLRTLTLAALFERRGFVRQEDFGSFALLLSAADGDVLRQFIAEAIGPLETYDRTHGTELLPTTAAFLDLACRHQATAKRLGVHVSTLRYRLGRVRELFELDLEEPEVRFRLSFALRLRRIAGGGG